MLVISEHQIFREQDLLLLKIFLGLRLQFLALMGYPILHHPLND